MQLLVAGGRQGCEWVFLDNRSCLKVVAEDKGEEDQMEIQKAPEALICAPRSPAGVGRPLFPHPGARWPSAHPHDQSLYILKILPRHLAISCRLCARV